MQVFMHLCIGYCVDSLGLGGHLQQTVAFLQHVPCYLGVADKRSREWCWGWPFVAVELWRDAAGKELGMEVRPQIEAG